MAADSNEKLLEVTSLSVTLERNKVRFEIVKDVSFSLYRKETVALVGESGSGKTTTANALLGLLPKKNGFHTSGEVMFEGKNILELTDAKLRAISGAKISMIFQDPATALNPVFSIGHQVAEVFEIHAGATCEESEIKTVYALEQVGLSSIAHPFDTYPHQLSGGMKQRVMIAMGIALGPQVLIADEPTSALDLSVQREILELLNEYRERDSLALLLITHDFTVVEQIADRVIVMYLGEFVEEASCQELFTMPAHPYTKSLMQARPTKEKRKKLLPTVGGTIPNVMARPAGCPFHTRCPFVMEKCRQGEVLSFTLSPTHKVRCWLYEENGIRK